MPSTTSSEMITWEQIQSELFFAPDPKTSTLSGKALQQWQELVANAIVLLPTDGSAETRPQKLSAITQAIDINKSKYSELTQVYADRLNRQLSLTRAKLQTTNKDLLAISSTAKECGQLAYAASVFANLAGSKVGPTLNMMAQGAMGLSSSCAALSSGFAIGPAGICAASVVMIGQAFLSLSSDNDSSNGLSEAFCALFSGLQHISNQIFQLSQFVEKKFEELFKKLDEHHREVKDYLEHIKDFLGFIEGGMTENYLQQIAILDRVIKIDVNHSISNAIVAESRYLILLETIGHNLKDNPLYDAKNIFEDIAKLKAEFTGISTVYQEAIGFITENSSEFIRFFDLKYFSKNPGLTLSVLLRDNPRLNSLPKLTLPYTLTLSTYELITHLVAKSRILFKEDDATPQVLEDLIIKLEQELNAHSATHAAVANTEVKQILWKRFVKSADDFVTVISKVAEEQETALYLGADPRYNSFKELPAIESLKRNLEKFNSYQIQHQNPGPSYWFYMHQQDVRGGWQHVYQDYAYNGYVNTRNADITAIKTIHTQKIQETIFNKVALLLTHINRAESTYPRNPIALFEYGTQPLLITNDTNKQVEYTTQLRGKKPFRYIPLTRFILPLSDADPILPISRESIFDIPEYLGKLEQSGCGEVVLCYCAEDIRHEEGAGTVTVKLKVHVLWKSSSQAETSIANPIEFEYKHGLNYTRSDAIWLAWAGGKNIPAGRNKETFQVSSGGNRQTFYDCEFGASRDGFMSKFKFCVVWQIREDLQQNLALYQQKLRRGFTQDILKKMTVAGPINTVLNELVLSSTILQLYLLNYNSAIGLGERSAAVFTGFPSYRQLYTFLSTYNGGEIFLDNILSVSINVVKQFYDFIGTHIEPFITQRVEVAWGKFLSGKDLESKLLVMATKEVETKYEEEYASGVVIGKKIMRTFIDGYLSSHGHGTATGEMEESYEFTANASMALRCGISAGINNELMQSLVNLSTAQFEKARALILSIIPKLQKLAEPANLTGGIEFKLEQLAPSASPVAGGVQEQQSAGNARSSTPRFYKPSSIDRESSNTVNADNFLPKMGVP